MWLKAGLLIIETYKNVAGEPEFSRTFRGRIWLSDAEAEWAERGWSVRLYGSGSVLMAVLTKCCRR